MIDLFYLIIYQQWSKETSFKFYLNTIYKIIRNIVVKKLIIANKICLKKVIQYIL